MPADAPTFQPLSQPTRDLAAPQQQQDNITPLSTRQRLQKAMEAPHEDITFASSNDSLQRLRGYDNPYGAGIKAYEPDTVLFTDYANAKSAVDQSKAEEALRNAPPATTSVDFSQPNFATGGIAQADGQVNAMIQAAMGAVGKPYVWGGTNLATGVDCSGLIYAAARAAGIPWQRYRAVDYGHMGTAVDLKSARAGDIVYYDEAGDTDHVGIYLGNGKMIQAPQTGDVVKVSSVGNFTSIRRVFNDGAFAASPTPDGSAVATYNGRPYTPSLTATVSSMLPHFGGTPAAAAPSITRTAPAGAGRNRAI